jgi:hypothetical protein
MHNIKVAVITIFFQLFRMDGTMLVINIITKIVVVDIELNEFILKFIFVIYSLNYY